MYWMRARWSLAPWPRMTGKPVPVSLTPRGKSKMPSLSPICMWSGIGKAGSFHSPTWRMTLFALESGPVGISGAGMFGIMSSVSRRSVSTWASSRSISAMRSPIVRISALAAEMSPPDFARAPISLEAALRFALSVSVSARRVRRFASRSRAFATFSCSTPRRASCATVLSKSSRIFLMSIMVLLLSFWKLGVSISKSQSLRRPR